MKNQFQLFIRKCAAAIAAITMFACVSQAETLYTSLQETPVRDKPVALGSTILAKLKSGSMIETVKEVGAFTAVSFIQDGKVKTGFIATSQIRANKKEGAMGAVETAQTIDTADPASMINGLGSESVAGGGSGSAATPLAAKTTLPAGSEDPASLLTSKLDSLQVPAKDLATFATNGKLMSRRPKGK